MNKAYFIVFFSLILLQLLVIFITTAFAQQTGVLPCEMNNNYGLEHVYYNNDYSTYQNPYLDLTLQYPSYWKVLDFTGSPLSNLIGLVYFEIPSQTDKIKGSLLEENDVAIDPNISIIAEKLSSENISLSEYAKIQYDNLKQLFSDFDLKINNITIDNSVGNNYSHIDNHAAWKVIYSIDIDPYETDGSKKVRNGLMIWLVRGETAYGFSYIAYEDKYYNNLEEVQKMIDSIKIDDVLIKPNFANCGR